MRQVLTYECDGKKPSDSEIMEGIDITNEQDVIVVLRWFFPHNGWYQLHIEPGMSFEECKAKLPASYPV